MKHTILTLAIMAALVASACSGDTTEVESSDTAPATTTSGSGTGSSGLDACIDAIDMLTADIDLNATDATAALETAFAGELPDQCGFLADGDAASVGLTEDELFEALENTLPPAVWEFLSEPAGESFEHTVDEL